MYIVKRFNMTKTKKNDLLYRDDDAADTIKSVMCHNSRTTTTIRHKMMMLLILSSSLALKVLMLRPEISLVTFAQANEASVVANHRNLIPNTSKNRTRQRRRLSHFFFDAMAMTYSDTSELEKLVATRTKKNTIIEQENASRRLQGSGGLLATRKFPECIQQGLSPEECQAWIKEQIDGAGGHEVGDVNVKIQTPRTPEQFAESYWMVEVPVNLYNKVTCDRNEGKTFYPLKWTDGLAGTTLDVEDQDCYGLLGGACCMKLRSYGKQLTTSGYDEQKQCLSCFVHLEPLEPVVNDETGETDYVECKDLDDGKCVREQLTGAEVDALDLQTSGRIETAIASLESFQTNRSCDTFDQLLEELYNAAAVIKPLSIKLGRLGCTVCYGIHDLNLEDNFVTFQLAEILMMLKRHSPPAKQIDSKENCIIIYTDPDGKVVRDPTLGGSRADMTDKESVPHVPPAPTPTLPPVEDDDAPPVCQDDTDCSDTEWCNIYGYCSENVCITNPPVNCQGENQVCEPNPYDYYNYYTCTTIDCNMDPSICGENEYCRSDIDYFYFEEVYTCEEYKDPGEDCGFSYYGTDYNQAIFDGECDPDVSFCNTPYSCTHTGDPFLVYFRECVAYGEGSCRDEVTGEVTQANCNDNEYCPYAQARCRPKLKKGECCFPFLDGCGYGSASESLICAPDKKYIDYYGYVLNYYICQKKCDIDDDCGTNEWCAPVDEVNNPSLYPGKFCKEYKTLGDYCHVQYPGLIQQDIHTEERCDPSNSYCYDPLFCFSQSDYYFQSQCRSYGNACANDSDCANATTEWCDVDVGYCKKRSSSSDCCTTAGEATKNDCPPESFCEPTTPDYQYDVGAAICT